MFSFLFLSQNSENKDRKDTLVVADPPPNIFRANFSTYILHDIHDILYTTSVSRIEEVRLS